jgi:hypothetical protein
MSPYAHAFNVAASTLARQPATHRITGLQALQRHLSAKLLDTAPPEGAAIEVLWARAGTPGEVGETWMPGTYLGTTGSGAGRRLLVRSATPRSAGPVVRPVSPESVRLLPAPEADDLAAAEGARS